MKNMLFEQKSWHFAKNKTEIMQYILNMQ